MIRDGHESRRVARRTANGATRARSAPDQPQHGLLELQQQLGNAAVTRLLQRAPRERPQSTDAPGAPKRSRPRPKPPKKQGPDIRARVIKADIVEGKTRIVIGSGPEQGVELGMSGRLVDAKGTELEGFTIDKVEGRVSFGFVDAILDRVRANPQVIIKASTFVPRESMEGKEF